MGTSVPRALISTLLIAGVFYAPFAPQAYADEATTTPEVFTESVATSTTATSSSQASQDVSSSTPTLQQTSLEVEASSTPSTPLPTGVLLDNSFNDIPWSIQVYDGTGYPGHYVYYFTGFRSVGNPPVLSPETAWISTGTTTVVRVKRISGTACSDLVYGGTGGLTILGPDFTSYETNARWTSAVGDFCDFQLYGEGIPPGTPLSGMYLGTYPETILTGSHANTGISLNALNSDPVSGGFAFQLCGSSGCAGGFGSSTPTATTTASTTPPGPQVSNVLFLPGIKGSRLYDSDTRCGVIGCDNKLWDPASRIDIEDLYLTPEGKSSRPDIYTKEEDIIDAIPSKKIYASFIEDMDELQASTTFDGGNFKWKSAAYDWRLSLEDIINNGVEREGNIYYEEASSTPYIEQTLRQLAQTSTTGKVTIIAHSNGGLVTKALLSKLGEVETAALVDKIIFVGVPQTGAPQALGGLLFGDREGLPLDILPLIASPATARGLAENSPMAYHLIPSSQYLADTQDSNHSTIGFSGSTLFTKERSAYGPSVDTIAELDNFLLANEGGRTKPDAGDASAANVLNSKLISYANTIHDSLDSWIPPESVTLYQIAGWGDNTISGIDFYDEKKLFGLNIGYKRQYRPVFVEDGDGVVPVPSALEMNSASNVKRLWIDLTQAKKLLQKYEHGNILETGSLRTLLFDIMSDTGNPTPEFIYSFQPPTSNLKKKLIFQLHSPLTLGIYDENGNHTGLNTDGSVDENIPGAEYGEFGNVKYLIVPAGQPYQLVMHGQSDGSFSLDIQEQTGNTITASATLADLPTTASTAARLSITNGIADASGLQVDSDGNGSTDITTSARIGETVNYAPATIENSPKLYGHSTSLINVKEVTIPVTLSSDNLLKSTALINPVRYVQPTRAEATPKDSKVVSEIATEARVQSTQTASAYDAFVSVAYWLQTALYNIWQALMRIFNL